MALVEVTDDGLEIIFDESESSILPKVGPFLLVVLGGRRLGNRYVVTGSDVSRALVSVTQFLGKQGVKLDFGPLAHDAFAALKSAEQEYELAVKAGRQVPSADALDLNGFTRTLTEKQRASVEHLVAVTHGANFSVPGAGKTTIAYAFYAALRAKRIVDRLLVVAPRAAFQPWEDEFEECFGTAPQSVRLTGSPGERQRFYLEPGTAELFLITYQMAANDVDQLRGLCRRESMMLVLDESHYVKRFEEGRWANAVLELAPFAERRLVLSGTPMPQGCEDLWTQFTFLWPGRQVLGERAQFRRECESGDLSSVKEKVAPFFRRITKSDLDLPELVVERIRVQMAPQQDRIYSAIAEKVLADSAFEPSDRQAIRYWRRARMVRLLQAASNPSLLGEYSEEFDLNSSDANESRIVELAKRYHEYEIPAKFQVASALTEHLVASGRKVVVWTTFVRNISMFRSLVKELAPSFIVYGAVPKDYSEDEEFNREQQIEGFKGVSGPAILIANPAACGESISLHHASTDALYIDRSFDCAKYLQSQDRVHRLGLPKDARVHIRLLLASETIDEVVDNRLGEKAERMMRLLGDDFPIGQPEDIDDNDLEQEEDYTATLASVRARLSAD